MPGRRIGQPVTASAAAIVNATAMMAIFMYLPATLLWVATIALAAKLSWMLFRLGARMFHKPEASAT